MSLLKTFSGDISFCPGCGALLPPLPNVGNVFCLACKYEVPAEAFQEVEMSYTVVFNQKDEGGKRRRKVKEEEEPDGPTVERKCPKCGHDQMSYAALQLRSADEGQTVFFTCLKCKYKESENS